MPKIIAPPPAYFFNPSTLKELCRQYGFSPSKSFGQNFLLSEKPVAAMIKAAELTPDDTVLEIGPGFGALTLSVAPLVKKVIALEIEQKLMPYWEERQREHKNVELVWGDALENLQAASPSVGPRQSDGFGAGRRKFMNLQTVQQSAGRRASQEAAHFILSKNYKVLANLPYQITSHALRVVLALAPPPERVIVMVQREVAQRICALAGNMSLLSVSVQYYGMPRIVATVPRGQFWPAPEVDSAVVAITGLRERRRVIEQSAVAPEKFFQIVRAAFAHKRKQAWRNIASGCGLDERLVKQALAEVAGNEKARAEELGVAEWEAVADKLLADV